MFGVCIRFRHVFMLAVDEGGDVLNVVRVTRRSLIRERPNAGGHAGGR